MDTATDTYGSRHIEKTNDSVSVRGDVHHYLSLRTTYTQTRNVQTQAQSTVTFTADP